MTPTESRRGGAVLAVLLMAPLLAQADATIANVATPPIQTDLGASSAAAELVMGGYLIAYAVLLIMGARLGQTHGYKRIFMLGVTGFAVSSLLGGLAPNATVLVTMRVLQGASAALMFPQALTGIQLNFSDDRRTRAIGLYAIALSTGAVIGQVLGGVLVAANIAGLGWRTIFLINVPVCAAVLAAAKRYLPADGRLGAQRVHLLGIVTLSVSVLLIVLPLTLGRTEGWPLWTWVSLAASGPAVALFVVAQRGVSAPLVNLRVVTQPAVSFGLLTLAVAISTYYALLFTLAQYLQHGLGRGSITSGLVLVPWVAAFGLAGQLIRRLPVRYRPLAPFAGCLLLSAAYLTISASLFAGTARLLVLVPLLAAGGLGLGIQFSALLGHLTNAVHPRFAADISGTSTTTMQIGGAVGIAVFGAIYLSLAVPTGATQATHAFAVTALAMGSAALVAALLAWRTTHSLPETSQVDATVRLP